MVSSAIVKITAKTALKGKWLKACVGGMVPVCAFLAVILTSETLWFAFGHIGSQILSAVLSFFLLLPLILGTLRFFWRFLCDADDNIVVIFHYFTSKKLYFKALHLSFAIVSRAVLFGLILNVPALLLDLFSKPWIYDVTKMAIPLWASNLWALAVFFRVSAFVVLYFVMLRYYLAPMLVVADENIEVAEAIHMSAGIRKSTSLEFVLLTFSMLGWIILSLFFIPLVFTVPYFITVYLVHARFAVAHYNKLIKGNSIPAVPTYTPYGSDCI